MPRSESKVVGKTYSKKHRIVAPRNMRETPMLSPLLIRKFPTFTIQKTSITLQTINTIGEPIGDKNRKILVDI